MSLHEGIIMVGIIAAISCGVIGRIGMLLEHRRIQREYNKHFATWVGDNGNILRIDNITRKENKND